MSETDMEPERRILLVDCDMFYVQVARLEDPEGAGREELLIVGGSPAGRGVVTSASYPTRAYGVRAGMPTARALKLCPEAKVVSVSRKACAARSRAVRKVLQRLCPVVQAASIDEFYLDLTGMERLLHSESLEATARQIQARVRRETGISVSIGGGTRRLIAKLASGRAKPGGVLVVPPGEEARFMTGFRLDEIPGVGPVLAASLRSKGLVTVTDLLATEREWLDRWLGPSRAQWLWEVAHGIDPSAVRPGEPPKSISAERTFAVDLTEDEELRGRLLAFSSRVGATLRKKGLKARTISVKVRDDDFRTRQAAHTLPDAVETDHAIYSVACALLTELRRKRRRGVRLLGLGVSTLLPSEGPDQLELFHEGGAEEESPRTRVLFRVLDDIRTRFGEDAILPARLIENRDRRGRVP